MGKGDRRQWHSRQWHIGILAILWAIAAMVDRLWLWLDRSMPSWDPADHLIGALNYGWTLQNAQWFSSEWWRGLWMLSSKYPPLLYISTAPVLRLAGTEADAAVLVNLFFTAILLGSVYGLGKRLLSAELGLWAAGLCLLFPRFYTVRTQYFMDYPLVALVVLSFLCLTVWRDAKTTLGQWGWAIAFGSSFGLALLMKQSALFFFVVPLLWVGGSALWRRHWERVAQLGVAASVAIALLFPWLQQNWLFQISAGFNSNVKSAVSEGDPALQTLGAWTYYGRDLPGAVSLPLFVMAIAGLLWRVLKPQADRGRGGRSSSHWIWLTGFVLGAYGVWSAVLNKDERYTMPYLPVVALFLAYGLLQWRGRWGWLRWATVGVAIAVMLLNLFPVGGAIGQRITLVLSPNAQQYPYMQGSFLHAAVVDEILQAEPYQTANVGTLHSTATLNQHNLTYFGNQRNFQVYARRVGNLDRHLEQDVRSMDWILTKTGKDRSDSGKTRRQRAEVMKLVRGSGEFRRQQVWTLPGGDRLFLFHRRSPAVQLRPLEGTTLTSIRLDRVEVPASAPPGEPIPITYEWSGNWRQLHAGLVLVTWQAEGPRLDEPTPFWHDHALGLGRLHPGAIQANQVVQAATTVEPERSFQLVERTALVAPATTVPGSYRLTVTYIDRQSGETYAIPTPPTRLTIDPQAPTTAAPVLDWVSQLRTIATSLSAGLPALDAAFDQIDRLNLYDPNQSYIVQAEESLRIRLQNQPSDRNAAYALALAQVLQRDVPGAIAALERVTQLDAQNSNAYAYLGFINLYGFRPWAAEQALRQARTLEGNSAEIQGLSAIAALMRGNLRQAWHYGQTARALQPQE